MVASAVTAEGWREDARSATRMAGVPCSVVVFSPGPGPPSWSSVLRPPSSVLVLVPHPGPPSSVPVLVLHPARGPHARSDRPWTGAPASRTPNAHGNHPRLLASTHGPPFALPPRMAGVPCSVLVFGPPSSVPVLGLPSWSRVLVPHPGPHPSSCSWPTRPIGSSQDRRPLVPDTPRRPQPPWASSTHGRGSSSPVRGWPPSASR
jgi:hypothetical protein